MIDYTGKFAKMIQCLLYPLSILCLKFKLVITNNCNFVQLDRTDIDNTKKIYVCLCLFVFEPILRYPNRRDVSFARIEEFSFQINIYDFSFTLINT